LSKYNSGTVDDSHLFRPRGENQNPSRVGSRPDGLAIGSKLGNSYTALLFSDSVGVNVRSSVLNRLLNLTLHYWRREGKVGFSKAGESTVDS
jgi:hypothetical protein